MKLIITQTLLTATLLSLSVLTGFGQTPSKKEILAGQLCDELNVQKTYDSAFDAMPKMQAQMFATQKLSPQEQQQITKQMQTSMQAAKSAMDWNTIKPIFVKIYADNFDEADLEGMIAFYQTPVGRKWIEKQPQIQTATMQAMSQLMPKIMAAVMKASTPTESPAPTGKAP